MTTSPAPDPRWPRAADWLAAGPASGERADLAVVGVGTYATSLSGSGAHATPRAVRRTLRRLSTWAPRLGLDLNDRVRPVDLGDVEDPDLDDDGEWRTATRAATGVAVARVLLALGGDNALTCPVALAAFGADLPTAGLVTLDAHHDYREGRSNGSPVRRLVEAGLDPTRIVQVGIADWANSRSYADEVAATGVHVLSRDDVERRGIGDCMAEALDLAGGAGGPIHVDLDVDVCDRAVAPGCPASLPGGLSARELLSAAHDAARHPQVRSLDTAEVDATADPDGRTVRLVALCLLEIAAGLALRDDRPERPDRADGRDRPGGAIPGG